MDIRKEWIGIAVAIGFVAKKKKNNDTPKNMKYEDNKG